MAKDSANQIIQLSKSFVLPFILLILSRMSLHGYELFQKLETFGFHTIDQGSLYRLLRQLEKENLVSSEMGYYGKWSGKAMLQNHRGRRYILKGICKSTRNLPINVRSILHNVF
jgi:PadR family transcriptional regulator, regulatory protein PadR